jgi:hypothetical protein
LFGAKRQEPIYHTEDDERWDDSSPSWGSPLPRIDAAEGLMRLARKSKAYDQEILAAIDKLAIDPHPAVRHIIAHSIGQLWDVDRDRFWRLVEHFSMHEPRMSVLHFFANQVLLQLPHSECMRADSLIQAIYRRVKDNSKSSHVREACAIHFLRRALWDSDANASQWLDEAIATPIVHRVELATIVGSCRNLLTHRDPARTEEENRRVRVWAFSLLRRIFESAASICVPLFQSQQTLSDDNVELTRELFHLLESTVLQVHFAAESLDKSQGQNDSDSNVIMIRGDDLAKQFFDEARELLNVACESPFSRIAYDLLKTLRQLRDANPQQVFLLIGKAVDAATQDQFQFEAMAADLFVEIVEEYLAEYRGMFRAYDDMLPALMSLLDHFVSAGWPRAVSLTYRLDEVFRG